MDVSEGMQTVVLESPGSTTLDQLKRWLVNLSCALSVFRLTSVVSIAKFGVRSEKLSVSDHVQHQIEQTHIQDCKIGTQCTM